MEGVLEGAVIAVCHDDDLAARRWFRTIRTASAAAHPASDVWSALRERLIEQALVDGVPATTVAAFLDYLDAFAADPAHVIRCIAEMMAHEELLMAAYRELSAAAGAREMES
jgi:hypothetical protein